jgi:UDP-N-acetylmuramoylalanine--D-glutamate ligase
MDIKGKKVLIVGFGRSGLAAAKYCFERGALVTVTDEKPESAFKKDVAEAFGPASNCGGLKSAATYFGSHPLHLFEEADVIIPSPGVPLDMEGLKVARKRGVPIMGEMELVISEIKAPIIAITGTNGKSTVTTLIGEMLKEAGKKALVGGNLGTPLIELLRTTSDERLTTDFIVLEVSSYQLEITPNFHPHIALLLNITPDHLDRYASYDEYIAAKELIVRNLTAKDHFIYNEEDPLVKKIAKKTKAKKTGFATEEIGSRKSEVRSPTSDFSPLLLTIDLSRAKIKGQHNKENIIAAVLAAGVAGCSAEAVQRVIETFKGLPHRNQFVREVSGVKYFDDSKGTNVGAVVKSLEGFDSKVVLIAGGLDKGGSYDPLRPLIKEKVKALVLIGTAKDKIANELGDLTKVVKAGSMADAVREASALALTGDVVLLSPACASFDMFKDYADRGNKFAEEVKKL